MAVRWLWVLIPAQPAVLSSVGEVLLFIYFLPYELGRLATTTAAGAAYLFIYLFIYLPTAHASGLYR